MYCVACVYTERVRGCDGDGNAGVGAEGGMVAVSAGCEHMAGPYFLCLLQTSC